jgi:DinB family protein
MDDLSRELRETVTSATGALLAIGEKRASVRPAPGKWSRKEILGHLIDSAANNHQRFVRAQLQEDLVFPGYDQDAWVRVQGYQHASWEELVTLWRAYNLHVARVVETADPEECARPRARHNLDAIAFVTVPAREPATLAYLMRDYLAHLKHHLRQALA